MRRGWFGLCRATGSVGAVRYDPGARSAEAFSSPINRSSMPSRPWRLHTPRTPLDETRSQPAPARRRPTGRNGIDRQGHGRGRHPRHPVDPIEVWVCAGQPCWLASRRCRSWKFAPDLVEQLAAVAYDTVGFADIPEIYGKLEQAELALGSNLAKASQSALSAHSVSSRCHALLNKTLHGLSAPKTSSVISALTSACFTL